jgi:hypothetical protein
MVDSGDDTRKKRECPHAGQESSGDTPVPEKCKKFRRVKNSRNAEVECMDIETAMHRILHPEREPLSNDMYVTFRAGHAGDAPAIETLYHGGGNADTTKEQHMEESASSLELWLSEGMGDEDAPPTVFSILAEISSENQSRSSHLAAVALFTVAWEANQRMLRVEWCHVDKSVLARRMWLRLSALALMTGACLCITEDCPDFGIANDSR